MSSYQVRVAGIQTSNGNIFLMIGAGAINSYSKDAVVCETKLYGSQLPYAVVARKADGSHMITSRRGAKKIGAEVVA